MLRPKFVKQMADLRSRVMTSADPKTIKSGRVSGYMLVELAQSWVQAVNDGQVPNIEDTWTNVCQAECRKHVAALQTKYAAAQRELRDSLPLSEAELHAWHREAVDDARKAFSKQTATLQEDMRAAALDSLEALLAGEWEALLAANETQSQEQARNLLQTHFTALEEAVERDQFKSWAGPGGFHEAKEKARRAVLSAHTRADAHSVLCLVAERVEKLTGKAAQRMFVLLAHAHDEAAAALQAQIASLEAAKRAEVGHLSGELENARLRAQLVQEQQDQSEARATAVKEQLASERARAEELGRRIHTLEADHSERANRMQQEIDTLRAAERQSKRDWEEERSRVSRDADDRVAALQAQLEELQESLRRAQQDKSRDVERAVTALAGERARADKEAEMRAQERMEAQQELEKAKASWGEQMELALVEARRIAAEGGAKARLEEEREREKQRESEVEDWRRRLSLADEAREHERQQQSARLRASVQERLAMLTSVAEVLGGLSDVVSIACADSEGVDAEDVRMGGAEWARVLEKVKMMCRENESWRQRVLAMEAQRRAVGLRQERTVRLATELRAAIDLAASDAVELVIAPAGPALRVDGQEYVDGALQRLWDQCRVNENLSDVLAGTPPERAKLPAASDESAGMDGTEDGVADVLHHELWHASVDHCLDYCANTYGWDLRQLARDLGLDVYGSIRCVNYLRRAVAEGRAAQPDVTDAELLRQIRRPFDAANPPALLDDDTYLYPYLDDDALLPALGHESLGGAQEAGGGAGSQVVDRQGLRDAEGGVLWEEGLSVRCAGPVSAAMGDSASLVSSSASSSSSISPRLLAAYTPSTPSPKRPTAPSDRPALAAERSNGGLGSSHGTSVTSAGSPARSRRLSDLPAHTPRTPLCKLPEHPPNSHTPATPAYSSASDTPGRRAPPTPSPPNPTPVSLLPAGHRGRENRNQLDLSHIATPENSGTAAHGGGGRAAEETAELESRLAALERSWQAALMNGAGGAGDWQVPEHLSTQWSVAPSEPPGSVFSSPPPPFLSGLAGGAVGVEAYGSGGLLSAPALAAACKLIRVSLCLDDRGKSFTKYHLIVLLAHGGTLELARRFSEFVKLHAKLSLLFPYVQMPKVAAPLFSGRGSWFNRFDPELIQRRQVWLEEYLMALIRIPECEKSEPFRLFLAGNADTCGNGSTTSGVHPDDAWAAPSVGSHASCAGSVADSVATFPCLNMRPCDTDR